MARSKGVAAVEAVLREAFDVVLMDCQMPEMDGMSATRAIRERERATGGTAVPIIAVTANAYEEDRLRCLDAGMTGYLSKPVTEDQLHVALRRWGPQSRRHPEMVSA